MLLALTSMSSTVAASLAELGTKAGSGVVHRQSRRSDHVGEQAGGPLATQPGSVIIVPAACRSSGVRAPSSSGGSR